MPDEREAPLQVTAPRVAALMTCHNRRETTLACLLSVLEQSGSGQVDLYLTDDGCTDGTADAVRNLWPGATILPGSGHLYWAAGMALAERAAVRGRPDFLLWLNDDTVLADGGFVRLLACAEDHPGAIVVGATCDPQSGESTYGARLRVDHHPQRFLRLPISDEPQWADTFNGNVVLVPWAARQEVGPIDGLFPHAYADDDFGLRATARGVQVVQAPGVVGLCPRNPPRPPLVGGPISRWRQMQAPMAQPWRAQARFLRRHGDWRWPLLLVAGQARRLMAGEHPSPTRTLEKPPTRG